jgi:hypothetical protein
MGCIEYATPIGGRRTAKPHDVSVWSPKRTHWVTRMSPARPP